MVLTYPWYLLGLFFAAIPIIIHLLQLRKPQRHLFTNTAFIREVELVTVRHRKLQEYLILLARVLAVVGLVLVFCQPFIPAAQSAGGLTVGTDVLVDDSYSMQQPSSVEGSLFTEATNEAKSLVQLATGGSRFRLINTGAGLVTREAFENKVDELKLTGKSSFNKAVGLSKGSQSSDSKLIVLSDFQKNTFNPHSFDIIKKEREVILVPLVGREVANVYVDSIWLDDAFVRARTNVGLHLRLRNGGGLVSTDCPVKVFLGLKQVASFRITLQPGQVAASVVQVQVADDDLAQGRVVTEDAPVIFDNTFYFTLQPAAGIKILEIGSEPILQQVYGNEPLFSYGFSKPQAVNYGGLRQANLVVVREIGQIDAGLREGLKDVVKRGGSVVLVPSSASEGRGTYQQAFKELGLGQVQWEAKTSNVDLRELAMPNSREPFFREVFGAQQRAVTMPRVAPVLRWSRTGSDLLRTRDGESYLAKFQSGAGQVYVFSAPFSKEYSDFVQHALYVPVMYRMAMLSYRNEQLPSYRLSQTMVSLTLPVGLDATGRADEVGFRLVKDSLILIPAQRVAGQEVRLELPAGMDEPGFYQVQRQGKVLTTLAFNQDKKESELAAYSANELKTLVGDRPNIKVLEQGAKGITLAKYQAEQTGQPLWRYFLVFALACLLAEALLVRFASRRMSRARAKAVLS